MALDSKIVSLENTVSSVLKMVMVVSEISKLFSAIFRVRKSFLRCAGTGLDSAERFTGQNESSTSQLVYYCVQYGNQLNIRWCIESYYDVKIVLL